MSTWTEASLTSLGTVERGRSRHRPRNDPRLFGEGIPFFQTGDVKAATLHLRSASQEYSEFGIAQSRIWETGTTCITIAANIAESAVLGIPGCFPDSVLGFTPAEQPDDAYFVKYLLDVHRERLTASARGTTQDNLSLEKLLAHKFPIPDQITRVRIARILRSLDDLIENNRRRIGVLEEMARAIYREWFVYLRYPGHEDVPLVDSRLGPIPIGWTLSPLESVAAVNRRSRTPRADEVIRYLDISALGDRTVGSLRELEGGEAPGRARRVVEAGDVVWSMVRPNRRAHALLIDPGPEWIASTGLAVLSPTQVSSTWLFETTSTHEFSGYLVSQESGAAYPAVKPKDFERAPVVVPDSAVDRLFADRVCPMHRLTWSLREQSAALVAMRDVLLPRLVTGEIDVSHLDLDAVMEGAIA